MLLCDCSIYIILFFYMMWCMGSLIYFSWKKSRYEARKHMFYFITNSLGMLLALPLVINGFITFILEYDEIFQLRWTYYQDNFAKILPSLIYIATKKNEDCINCFNRLAPQTYSIMQYS